MSRKTVPYTEFMEEALALFPSPGLFLVSQGTDGVPNIMTIGWGTVGIIWGRKIFTVLVRPSRYTFSRLEQSDSFTVNIPTASHHEDLAFCGTKSGRDHDKFAECELTVEHSERVETPGIAECPVIYECQVVHANDVINASLAPDIVEGAYPTGNLHRIYYGEILTVRAVENAHEALSSP